MELPVCQGLRPTLWASSSQILDASSTCSSHQGFAMHQYAPRNTSGRISLSHLTTLGKHCGHVILGLHAQLVGWVASDLLQAGPPHVPVERQISALACSSVCCCGASSKDCRIKLKAQLALQHTAWKSWATLHISACRRSCRRPLRGRSFQCHPVQRTSLGVPAPSRKSIPSAYWALMRSASTENKCSRGVQTAPIFRVSRWAGLGFKSAGLGQVPPGRQAKKCGFGLKSRGEGVVSATLAEAVQR